MTELKLKFNSNYLKLHNQKKAELIKVWLDHKDFFSDEFIEYDTKKEDGSYYELDRGVYIVLLYLGDDNIPFTTIREYSRIKLQSYETLIGKKYDIEIVEELE